MPRVKRGQHHTKRRRYLLKRVKGFGGGRKKLMKLAKTADTKAGAHSYRDRKKKKQIMRKLWQVHVNAAARNEGMSYSQLIGALKKKQSVLDRKVLAEIGNEYPEVFAKIAQSVK